MKLTLKFFLLSLVLIILGQTYPVVYLRQRASRVSAPLYFGASQMGRFFRGQISFWFSLRSLAVENRELKRRVLELKSELSELKGAAKENEGLREQLGLEAKGKGDLLAVRVLGWEGLGASRFMVIGGGERDGLRVGMPILVGNFLLGKITEVGWCNARVWLITDPSFRVFAIDQDSKNPAKGVVRGFMPGKLKMERIFREEGISPGNTIVTSGEEGIFPSGLILGEVERVEQTEILKEAILNLRVDFSRLEEVFVLKQ